MLPGLPSPKPAEPAMAVAAPMAGTQPPEASLFEQLTSAEALAEFVAIVIAVLAAVLAGQLVKAWYRRSEQRLAREGWQARLLEGCVILAPYFFALVVLLAIRAGMALAELSISVVDITLRLVTALVLVRGAVYGLRLLIGARPWMRHWENRFTLFLWLAISFELLGWFDKIELALDSVDLLPGKATFSLWSLLKGIVIVTAFVLVTSIIARTIERRVMTLDAIALSTRIGISKFVYFLLVGLGVLLGINAAGVDLTALTILTGAIGLGLGFGMQQIAGNFMTGFVLLMDKSIKPGDVISFPGPNAGFGGTSSENFGWVQELRGRYVAVRDRDGVETLVPNSMFMTNPVINWSYSDQRVRLRLPVTVSYRDDPELALRLLVEAASDHPRILKDPAPVSRLMSFEDHGMRLESRFWIRDPMNGVNNVRSDVNRRIWALFSEHGITIPVSQREVRILPPPPT